jgi:hypothetical protein
MVGGRGVAFCDVDGWESEEVICVNELTKFVWELGDVELVLLSFCGFFLC